MAKDLLGSFKNYVNKISEGEHSATEVVSSLNTWVHESAESIKSKIEEEVEKSVSKMGFVKKEEFDRLAKEVKLLRSTAGGEKKTAVKKTAAKKTAPVKKSVKK